MNNFSRTRIVLICGNIHRELAMLQLLKKEFENTLKVDVWIIGSIADIQKIYYTLNKIKPNIVFISQIVEKVTRDIASYVRKSGAILCVLPAELTYTQAGEYSLLNTRQYYDKFVDYYFLPGQRMYKDISRLSDINKEKMFITGSPKIDLYKNKYAKKALTRREFCIRYSIPKNKKNIFIFTSFVTTPSNYIKSEKAYKGSVNFMLKRNKGTIEMREIFVNDIKRLCIDFPKYNIILKTHPVEDISFYEKINIKNFYIINNITFNDTINSIDLAIHWCSTVATECWVNGIKTLQYLPILGYKDLFTHYYLENPVYNNYLDLRKGILKYLIRNLDKKYLFYQKKYLRLSYYKTDGLSVKRIVVKIKKILQSNRDKVPNYVSATNKLLYILVIAEKVLGIRLSRRIVSLFKRDYDWRYAADNFVFRHPANY